MRTLRKNYDDGGLAHERAMAVMVNLPDEDAQKAEKGQHAEGGGDASEHANSSGNKLAVP